MNSQTVTVNLVPGLSTPAVVRISQYDVVRPLVFKIMDGTKEASFASGTTCKVEGTKPSGLGFSMSCDISGSTVSVNSGLAMTQEAGMIPAELRFTNGNQNVGTANFILAVEPSPHPDGTTDGTQETMQNLETRLQGEIDGLDTRVTALEAGGGGSGLTDDVKTALLNCFAHVAWVDADGQDYYDALESALNSGDLSVSLMLSQVSSSNTATTVGYGESYTTTLTASTGYTLNTVSVTMGGVDITSTSYSSGTVSIPSVTGNIVITATAVLAAQSITATYTQSGTVYDTDSLDSLKPDLVVTANYSGGGSDTVPASDYTLSGTLTVGTSTITVSYAGLTTTFSVTVSSNLIHAWDFTQSLNDTVGSVTVALTGATRDSSGIHFTAKNHYATMAGVIESDIRIEVDITEIDTTVTDKNLRLAMVTSDSGLVYRKTDGKWEWYLGGWRVPTIYSTDKHVFDGKTLVIKIDDDSIPTAYCDGNIVADNGAALTSYTDFILGSSDYTPFNMTITAARIYRGADS